MFTSCLISHHTADPTPDAGIAGTAERREPRTPGSVVSREPDVAATHGESVRFPHEGGTNHFHRDVQVPHHAAEQFELLVVLSPEHLRRSSEQLDH